MLRHINSVSKGMPPWIRKILLFESNLIGVHLEKMKKRRVVTQYGEK